MTTQSLLVCRCPTGHRPGHLYLCGYILRVWKVKLKEDTFHFRAWCLLHRQTILRGTGVKRMRKTEAVTEHRPWVTEKKKFTKRSLRFTEWEPWRRKQSVVHRPCILVCTGGGMGKSVPWVWRMMSGEKIAVSRGFPWAGRSHHWISATKKAQVKVAGMWVGTGSGSQIPEQLEAVGGVLELQLFQTVAWHLWSLSAETVWRRKKRRRSRKLTRSVGSESWQPELGPL